MYHHVDRLNHYSGIPCFVPGNVAKQLGDEDKRENVRNGDCVSGSVDRMCGPQLLARLE